MFDKLLLISEGYPIYYGRARGSLEYFSSLRFIPQIAMNPAEFLLDLATGQVDDISIPSDLSGTQASTCPEKAIIRVRNSIFKIPTKFSTLARRSCPQESHSYLFIFD